MNVSCNRVYIIMCMIIGYIRENKEKKRRFMSRDVIVAMGTDQQRMLDSTGKPALCEDYGRRAVFQAS